MTRLEATQNAIIEALKEHASAIRQLDVVGIQIHVRYFPNGGLPRKIQIEVQAESLRVSAMPNPASSRCQFWCQLDLGFHAGRCIIVQLS